jgi:predicted O-methyltransferase YrrM
VGYVTAKQVQRGEVPAVAGELVKNDRRVHIIVQPRGSHDVLASDLQPCDAVFIDGDHSRKGVLNDTHLALEKVRPGGIVIWHDYHNLGTVDVREVLHEMHREFPDMPLRHVGGTWLVYCRI